MSIIRDDLKGQRASHVGGVVVSLATETIGLGFESCDKDCIGASVTDLALCVHATWTACRIWRRVSAQRRRQGIHSRPWSFASLAVGAILSNASWSLLGACYWLQPGGLRFPGFEACWRLSAQCQVALFYFAYCLGLAFCRIGGISPTAVRHETLLSRCGMAHALAFGLLCLSPHTCLQHEYVLWGGVNIMPPLLSQWAVVMRLVVRHGLHRSGWSVPERRLPHPLLLAALSGFFYWLGNSAIIFGRHMGLPLWLRNATIGNSMPATTFEEMATFHLFGLVGNELLWRGYEWVAVEEVMADAARNDEPPTPTLTPTDASSGTGSDSDDEGTGPTLALGGAVGGAFVVASGKVRGAHGCGTPNDAGGAWLERLLSEPAEQLRRKNE